MALVRFSALFTYVHQPLSTDYNAHRFSSFSSFSFLPFTDFYVVRLPPLSLPPSRCSPLSHYFSSITRASAAFAAPLAGAATAGEGKSGRHVLPLPTITDVTAAPAPPGPLTVLPLPRAMAESVVRAALAIEREHVRRTGVSLLVDVDCAVRSTE